MLLNLLKFLILTQITMKREFCTFANIWWQQADAWNIKLKTRIISKEILVLNSKNILVQIRIFLSEQILCVFKKKKILAII